MRKRSRAVLGVLILALLIPIFLVASPNFNPEERQLRAYRYSTAQESEISANSVLSTLAQSMNPTQLKELRDKLHALAKLPDVIGLSVSTEDPVLVYLRAMEDFSSKMTEISAKLGDAQRALAAGDISQAQIDLSQLKELRSETRILLKSLYGLLGDVADDYEIDTGSQQQILGQLSDTFQEYSDQIDQLGSQIGIQQELTPTTLTVNSTSENVFVTEPFFVYGYLRAENGSALLGRNVTISWASNLTIATATGLSGGFNVSLTYPVGTEPGLVSVEASFEPEGPDIQMFLPSLGSTQIFLSYYPSVIKAEIAPGIAKPTESAVVSGKLTSEDGAPLDYRLITVVLDQTVLGNTSTTATGQFDFTFAVPSATTNGTHFLDVRYDATNDRFASTNVTLPFVVELIGTQVAFNLDRASILSGTSLAINGSVLYDNGTISYRGNVTVYVDDEAYSIQSVNGSFRVVIQPSIGLGFGSHSIQVAYTPADPWVQSSSAVKQVYVFNTPLIVVLVAVVPTLSALGVYLARRRRRVRAVTVPSPVARPFQVEKPLLKEEYTPKSLISAVNAELDHAGRVRRSFRLAQALVDRKLAEPAREGETHREYYDRVSGRIPQIKDTLKRLVELYELAEYGPDPADDAQSRQATEILLELREEIEAVE